jgi:hypothetical protein
MPGQAPDHMAGQPATIRGLLVAYKVDSPAGGYSAEQEQLRLQQRLDEAKVEAQRTSGAVESSGDSRAVRVQAASFAFECVPKDAVAARWRWISHQPATFEDKFLLLTDGTLIGRNIHGERPGSWARVSEWPVTTDQQEAKELLERRGHELTAQSKEASKSTPTPVDADLLAAYCALKEWAARNGVQ